LPDFEIDEALQRLGESQPDEFKLTDIELEPKVSKPAKSPFQFNEMFSDLLEEVSSLTDQEISKETYENHFGLGTAYREMDLTDEAIKEFQIALRALDSDRDPRKVIQCCGMLSTCYLKKGMPRSVLRWCQTGLSVPDLSSHEALAFRYDMGLAHIMAEDNEQALECFDKIFVVDTGYRDVAQRIDELKGGYKRHAP
jgi:pilus assembly protein FimV